MRNKVILELSRKQSVLLLWIVESILEFSTLFSRISDFDDSEIKDFCEFIHSNFK